MRQKKKNCLIFHPHPLPSHPPLLCPRGSSGTAGETLPHRDGATGSEDQGLSERVLLRSVMWKTQLSQSVSHILSYVGDTDSDVFHL